MGFWRKELTGSRSYTLTRISVLFPESVERLVDELLRDDLGLEEDAIDRGIVKNGCNVRYGILKGSRDWKWDQPAFACGVQLG